MAMATGTCVFVFLRLRFCPGYTRNNAGALRGGAGLCTITAPATVIKMPLGRAPRPDQITHVRHAYVAICTCYAYVHSHGTAIGTCGFVLQLRFCPGYIRNNGDHNAGGQPAEAARPCAAARGTAASGRPHPASRFTSHKHSTAACSCCF